MVKYEIGLINEEGKNCTPTIWPISQRGSYLPRIGEEVQIVLDKERGLEVMLKVVRVRHRIKNSPLILFSSEEYQGRNL